MNTHSRAALAHILRRKRETLGLSATQVARRAHLDPGTVTRIELGQINEPTAASLGAIAGVLDIPATDLFVVADWIPPDELPSLVPYLRARYGDLPAQVADELEGLIARLGLDQRTTEQQPVVEGVPDLDAATAPGGLSTVDAPRHERVEHELSN